jgi:hypothetical protein
MEQPKTSHPEAAGANDSSATSMNSARIIEILGNSDEI